MNHELSRIVIIGAGFAGLNAAKVLGRAGVASVTLIDSRNYHLFQPLLYQVALAGLNPSDIAAPIRSILSEYPRVHVLLAEATSVDLSQGIVHLDNEKQVGFDYLIVACGASHAYFGNEQWEKFAPGLKTLEQATEIRRRILTAFEEAEMAADPEQQRRLLTFVVIGGGPTGVELAGAIAEMSRFTLARDFRSIDPRLSRVVLVEAGSRILSAFHPQLSAAAVRSLEKLGVELEVETRVTLVDHEGVVAGGERVPAATVLWAAGVEANALAATLGVPLDPQGRVYVEPDLSLKDHRRVFVLGDLAHYPGPDGKPLPGLAPVALQQGKAAARNILSDLSGEPRRPYRYLDKGMLATIGKNKAVGEFHRLRFTGFSAWLAWLLIHIYYLTGFANRLLVVIQWAWSYATFKRGARLILGKDWRIYRHRTSEREAKNW